MSILLLKIWLIVLVIIDVMLIFQTFSRAVLFIAGRSGEIDWTVYNIIMFKIMAVAFLPITAVVLYLRKQ